MRSVSPDNAEFRFMLLDSGQTLGISFARLKRCEHVEAKEGVRYLFQIQDHFRAYPHSVS